MAYEYGKRPVPAGCGGLVLKLIHLSYYQVFACALSRFLLLVLVNVLPCSIDEAPSIVKAETTPHALISLSSTRTTDEGSQSRVPDYTVSRPLRHSVANSHPEAAVGRQTKPTMAATPCFMASVGNTVRVEDAANH